MAHKTVLEIVREAAPRLGIQRPTTAVGSTDVQVQQLVALLNEEGESLADRYDWEALTREKTFTTIAAEDQGLLVGGTILASTDGFKKILNDTLWDRSTDYQLQNSTPSRWQADKSSLTVGPYSRYRIRNSRLYMLPAPTAGLTIAFEYLTENWVTNTAGDEFRDSFTLDSDLPLLDSRIMTLGLKWRWRAAKRLTYAEDFQAYEYAVMDAMTRDGTKPMASMNGPDTENFSPYVVVPAGSWGV